MVVCDQVVSKTQYQKMMASSGEQEEASADEEEKPSGEEDEQSSDEESEQPSDKENEQSSDEQEEKPVEHLKNLHDADEGRTIFIRKSFSLLVSRKHSVGHIRV